MKAVSTNVEYGQKITDLRKYGKRLYEADHSGGYETDAVELRVKKNGLYTILEASACSCYEAVYSGWTEMTKQELLKMYKKRTDDYGCDGEMAKWIKENIADESTN